MSSPKGWLGVAVGILVSAAAVDAAAAEPASTLTEKEAAQLVTRALEAGIAGDQEKRRSLLNEALKAAPDFAPAHWQLGHVRRNGKWQKAAEAAAELAADATYAEYQKLREACGQSAIGQLRLARWCQKNGLLEEERLHWGGVLFHDASNQEAIKALGLHKYRNRWLTQEQIDRIKQFEEDLAKARDYWKPRLERWAETIERNLKGRDEAMAQLRAIDDPVAIPWLETFVSTRSAMLGKEVVAVLSQIERQEATDSLVRHALASEHDEVRAAAAAALKNRPLISFVGLLVESLTSPPEVKTWTLMAAVDPKSERTNFYTQHTALYVERLGAIQQFDDYVSVGGSRFVTRRLVNGDVTSSRGEPVDNELMKQANGRPLLIASQAAALEARNIRICELLQVATSQEFGRDQSAWWKWWIDYNELYTAQSKPVYQYDTQFTHQPPHITTFMSCFAATTPVHTNTGPRAISAVKPGEFVLAQSLESGEPAYRVVLSTTVRPTQKVLLLTIGDDQLECTLGHPFWVVGEGWKMAKELKIGDQLQRLGGAETVADIQQIDKETKAYNLIVADFANYFVGKSAILAHDNSSRRPTLAIVPGLQVNGSPTR